MSILVKYLTAMVKMDGSDLFLQAGKRPGIHVSGELKFYDTNVLDKALITTLVNELLACSPSQNDFATALQETGGADFSFRMSIDSVLRSFRVNIGTETNQRFMTIRLISGDAFSPEELGLKKELMARIIGSRGNGGLYLVTGATGSGKSTTLASIVNHINYNYGWIVRTIESPIEFYFPLDGKSMITQTEVPIHSKSFQLALEATLRQKPDVIMVGEIRDSKALEVAVHAAATGHIVLTTLHTSSAAETIQRMLGMAPDIMKPNILSMLSSCLQGVISQQLMPKVGGGRIMAYELLLSDPAIGHLIREGKIEQIPSKIQTGASKGMHTFDDYLIKLYREELVTREVAITFARNKEDVAKRIVSLQQSTKTA
ncbi:MAG TPA: PilT/PilU family type 4a pilus ATPase [Oligoflexia bacterium]|nr:PilT/PilU family type 4a pilus ATPase [Oligoflexia bacterium]HMP49425.1 PilT/PilU family type 4a pilus ATPase [Oligoflexia bacterium]